MGVPRIPLAPPLIYSPSFAAAAGSGPNGACALLHPFSSMAQCTIQCHVLQGSTHLVGNQTYCVWRVPLGEFANRSIEYSNIPRCILKQGMACGLPCMVWWGTFPVRCCCMRTGEDFLSGLEGLPKWKQDVIIKKREDLAEKEQEMAVREAEIARREKEATERYAQMQREREKASKPHSTRTPHSTPHSARTPHSTPHSTRTPHSTPHSITSRSLGVLQWHQKLCFEMRVASQPYVPGAGCNPCLVIRDACCIPALRSRCWVQNTSRSRFIRILRSRILIFLNSVLSMIDLSGQQRY